MTVRRIDNLTIRFDILNQVFEDGAIFLWCGESNRIRDINIRRTCIDRCLNNLQEEIQLCSGRILWRKFDNFKLRTSIRNMLTDCFQNLFLALIELILAVNRTGRDKDVNLRILGILERLVTSIYIRLDRTCQTCHCCFFQDLGNLLNGYK